ncbi:acyl-CoA dehydrogenase family protein [Streptosporangium amethystogenes]|uniref:acyl-CoA dehydrogenase family protein n=1 Tax=Streptosporangium amethystogenes TaxID=2002 RepID=UPI00068E5E88|nr:acyl-CoA dehydrogenase family protein [Streptosporangium amethystogenes]
MSAQQAACDLERFLGDPRDHTSRISFRTQVLADEREELAQPAVDALRQWGFPDFLVPEEVGGRLRSVEELLALWRVLARRDLALTVGYGATLLGALPVWSRGDDDQRARVAELIGAGGFGSFGLSERDRGSDLLASEVVAEPSGEGYLVSGTKWPIGNATRGRFATLFARTGAGPRGFSMLLLDKENSAADRWHNEPKVPTMGLRGGDLSGFTFDACPFPGRSLVGRQGVGLEEVLKTLQITRTLITSLSLGAADTALRVALSHARERRLYGRSVFAIPVIRDQLISAYADILIAECVALPTARAVSIAPERLSLWSAIAKYAVPVLTEEIISSMSAVLGARHFIRDGVADGVFQKLMRDHAIVSVFEGTTHVNLHVVASQLPSLRRGGLRDTDAVSMTELFTRSGPAPAWNPRTSRLRLTNDGLDEITQTWEEAVATVTKLCAASDPELTDALDSLDALWRGHWADVHRVLAEEGNLHSGVRGFELARRHCLLHAAACCVHTWLANRQGPRTFSTGAEWLLLCLRRLIGRLDSASPHGDSPHAAVVERELVRSLTENRLFSLAPFTLGGTPDPVAAGRR